MSLVATKAVGCATMKQCATAVLPELSLHQSIQTGIADPHGHFHMHGLCRQFMDVYINDIYRSLYILRCSCVTRSYLPAPSNV